MYTIVNSDYPALSTFKEKGLGTIKALCGADVPGGTTAYTKALESTDDNFLAKAIKMIETSVSFVGKQVVGKRRVKKELALRYYAGQATICYLKAIDTDSLSLSREAINHLAMYLYVKRSTLDDGWSSDDIEDQDIIAVLDHFNLTEKALKS